VHPQAHRGLEQPLHSATPIQHSLQLYLQLAEQVVQQLSIPKGEVSRLLILSVFRYCSRALVFAEAEIFPEADRCEKITVS